MTKYIQPKYSNLHITAKHKIDKRNFP